MNDKDWKIRKEALDNLEELLKSKSNRVSVNGLSDLI